MVIDTSGPECVVGLFDSADGTFCEMRGPAPNRHAELLFSVIDAALRKLGADYSDVSHVVAVVGPGSFTGLRASLAAVQGLGLSSNISVHGISLLELQAYLMIMSHPIPQEAHVMSTIEAPKADFVYCQTFSNALFPLSEVTFVKREELNEYDYSNIVTKHSCKLSVTANSMTIAKLLLYKIENNLPPTKLSPIYSRSYV